MLAAVAGLLGGAGAGIAYTFVRRLGSRKEDSKRIIFWFSAFSCALCLPFMIAGYKHMSALQLISLPLNGLGNGMQPFVSYNYGKADSARLKQGIKYVTIIAFIYVVCIWSVSMAFPVVYARLFSASEAVTQIVKSYTPMFLMGSIMFFVQMTLQNVNVGLGQAKEALLLAVNRKVVILIPLCFVLTHFLGFKGVYLSEGIADLVAGIVTAIVIFTSFPKIFRRREEEVKQAASN